MCFNEHLTFYVTVVHASQDDLDASKRIVECIVGLEHRVIRTRDAPIDIYMEPCVLHESYGSRCSEDVGEKILFERR